MKTLSVKVTPRSSRDEVVQLSDTSYKVFTTAAPEKGKANAQVLVLLAKRLGVNKSQLHLVAGLASREKIFHLQYN